MTVTIGTHFCGGEAVATKIMLVNTHLGCDMPDIEEPCDGSEHTNHNHFSFTNIPCCQNEFQTIQCADDFVNDATQTVFNFDFVVVFLHTALNLDLLPKATHQFYTVYISPPLKKDIPVLFQSFLI
ncbi:MAG: hypothetical protein PWQ54_2251 [Bacteroidales bacterium]|nr:hypothetical protein [Bacteroidales bacterium]